MNMKRAASQPLPSTGTAHNRPVTETAVCGYIRLNVQRELAQIIPREIVMVVYHYYGHDFGGSMILNGTERDALWRLLLTKKPLLRAGTTSKCFTASVDGFSAASFYSKCASVSPSILIIKSNWGAIFGAFTNIAWSLDGGYKAADSTASTFLYSLSNERIFEIKERDLEYSVYHGGKGTRDLDSDLIFYFGAAAGLLLYDECDARDDNFAYGGNKCGYHIPKGNMLCGGNKRNSHYSDKYEFRVEDYELFTVQLQSESDLATSEHRALHDLASHITSSKSQ